LRASLISVEREAPIDTVKSNAVDVVLVVDDIVDAVVDVVVEVDDKNYF